MSNNQEVPHVCPLELLALHEIARRLWYVFIVQDSNNAFRIKSLDWSEIPEQSDFMDCRDKVLNALPEILPVCFPKLLRNKLIDAVINLQFGYREALRWEFVHQDNLPFSISEPDAGQYGAIHFITPFEHFDDLSWAKLFVSDENQPLEDRFTFAALYCFEDMLYSLWDIIKADNLVPCDGTLEQIKGTFFGEFVTWWADHIEDKIKKGGGFTDDFYIDGFNKAVFDWNEYAARFFWEHFSTEMKNNFLSTFDVSVLGYSLPNKIRLAYFLYSLLSVRQKKDLISLACSKEGLIDEFWCHMLASYFRKSILNDILYFLDSIPLKFFANVLYKLLTEYICVSPAPVYNEVFIKIWKYLSVEQQIEILKSSNLFWPFKCVSKNMNEIELFEAVILPLPQAVKDEMLLEDWENSGHEILHYYFFDLRDYDKSLCYLLLFFLTYDAANRKLTLRDDALSLLHSFTDCKSHVLFIRNRFMFDVLNCKMALDYFIETLPVIEQLIRQAGEEATTLNVNYRAFLSNKIYPLLSVEDKIDFYPLISVGDSFYLY